MTLTTAVTNQKGGVGKTATTKEVGGALAEAGRSVLLVDLDPEGHLTGATGLPKATGDANLARALIGTWEGSLADLITPHSTTEAGGRLDVVVSSPEMLLVVRELDKVRNRELRLQRLLSAVDGIYDHVLIDCPPSLDILTDNALAAADGALVPVQAEDSSIAALQLLLSQVAAVDADLREKPLQLHGLVVNLMRRPMTTLARSVMEIYEGYEDLPVLATVPLSVTVVEAWRYGRTVVDYAPASEIADLYRDLAKVLEAAA
ncbi:ParA family protein [Streptomyces sp. ND04-05B]|uniref:ParA family protein n=1 Tax=Streptomyces sp. ND04-05B TaxID=3028693 RepID=UPI0029B4ADE7|nr:ParA family protein [Streptomyces sp. ND04-05B]MDX3064016.1 ParA family protein [Streptomyces sp. ND04-05B]